MAEYVIGLYQFEGTEDNHLSFPAAAVIMLIQGGEPGWWNGDYNGVQGWFPSSYVRPTEAGDPIPAAEAGAAGALAASGDGNYDIGQHDAQQGVALPPGWISCVTEEGNVYYLNEATNESSWDPPTADGAAAPAAGGYGGYAQQTPAPAGGGVMTSLPPPVQHQTSLRGDEDGDDDGGGGGGGGGGAPVVPAARAAPAAAPTPQAAAQPVQHEKFNKERDAFVDNFWGDANGQSGFDILVLKHRNGKEVCKDMAEFMRERSALEDAYAKGLAKLAGTKLGDEEEGTLKTAWNQIKMDMQTQAKAHATFAKQLSTELDQAIMSFKDSQKKSRKAYEKIIAEEKKNIAAKIPQVDKYHKAYVERMKECELADVKEARGQLDHMTKMDYMKVQTEAAKARKRRDQASDDYVKWINEYNTSLKSWEDSMINACMEFEDNEIERNKFLRDRLIKYVELKRSVNAESTSSLEMVANSVNSSNVLVDIEMFIKKTGTGSVRPQPLQFGQDTGDLAKSVSHGHGTASPMSKKKK